VTDAWRLPEEWRAYLDEADETLEFPDMFAVAEMLFHDNHLMMYGRDRAQELQPEVVAAVAELRGVGSRKRVARILTDAGWTDAAIGAETGSRRWVTDDCPPDCRYVAVEHWHGWFCDAPYVGGPGGIMEQPDFSEVAVKVAPRVIPIRKRGQR